MCHNFVAAANFDGSSDSPCHTRFSSELVVEVLQKYIAANTSDVIILDPFVCYAGLYMHGCGTYT